MKKPKSKKQTLFFSMHGKLQELLHEQNVLSPSLAFTHGVLYTIPVNSMLLFDQSNLQHIRTLTHTRSQSNERTTTTANNQRPRRRLGYCKLRSNGETSRATQVVANHRNDQNSCTNKRINEKVREIWRKKRKCL